MSTFLSLENKKEISSFISNYRFYLALVGGILLTLILGFFLKSWPVIFLSGIYCGIFYKRISRGVLVGFSANFLAWLLFFLYYAIFIPKALTLGGLFLSLAGVGGLDIVVVILTILIGGIGGAIGAYMGSAIHPFIPWPNWNKLLS
ncbi:MAG: hypothetical protein HeimC3_45880 [Candidatus Heimdallarchaeota archaeon LC_3]|nr:MAG: hypothetical protein HeimC3_45880 [Candidatus Heimdallarchaeota archaeon LC_3]